MKISSKRKRGAYTEFLRVSKSKSTHLGGGRGVVLKGKRRRSAIPRVR